MTTQLSERTSLSSALKTRTATQHERMHALMERAQAFSSRENYARFVAVQYLFQRDVEHLFGDAGVQAAVPDLDSRGRQASSLADLQDLGAAVPVEEVASAGVRMPAALGWLYVSEGSTLGAAFLFKEAQSRLGLSAEFGARHLAAYPEGRATVWRRFVASLDSESVAETDHEAVIAGTIAAYNRFGQLIQQHFGFSE
ncbi:biliverdin-producing heme oxygenase [Acidovorax soli]|uniref:biliverdin-producing heme oxygenase n=1 Tax=Acidovorax soli TaxID=592050 RepID=UPI0032B236BB